MKKILIIDDDTNIQIVLANLLKSKKYEPSVASSAKEAIEEIKNNFYDLVLLDIFLPDKDGLSLLKEIKNFDEELQVIILTAYGDVKNVVEAMRLGAFDYLTKPVSNEEIILAIERAFKDKKIKNELEYLKQQETKLLLGEKIVINSEKMIKIFEDAVKIAKTNYTVFIFGETGVGKEILAYWIHKNSPRQKNPFVVIDCGTLPKEIIESELFGYEKGAFTGAEKRNIGKIELADEGTLFLDEIGNLPLELQPKFLRVLEEKKFYRLGGTNLIEVDVRYICASNISLEELIEKEKFRKDLYYRLNEFKIEIPPLRERKEDIIHLANLFLKVANKELNKSIKYISKQAEEILLDYKWPGNIRELQNVIKTAAFFAEDVIERFHIENVLSKQTNLFLRDDVSFENLNLKQNIEKIEKNLIKYVLNKVNNNKEKASEILGITRKTLYEKLKKYYLGDKI